MGDKGFSRTLDFVTGLFDGDTVCSLPDAALSVVVHGQGREASCRDAARSARG